MCVHEKSTCHVFFFFGHACHVFMRVLFFLSSSLVCQKARFFLLQKGQVFCSIVIFLVKLFNSISNTSWGCDI